MSKPKSELKKPTSGGLRVLLTDTNRWPVVPRLAISFCNMGCKVAVLCPTPGHPVQKVSVERVFHYNGFKPADSLRTAIESFDPDLIVPSCDRGVEHLHKLHSISLSQGTAGSKIATLIERSLGSPDGFPIVSSRYELLKMAQSEGIPVPEMVAIESGTDLHLWSSKLAPPWVIKADGTWGGSGVKIAKDISEAEHFFLEFTNRASVVELAKRLLLDRDRGRSWFDWKHSRRSVIAQSMINGRPANCAVVCWQGKVLAGIAVEVIKTRGATGPATVVQIVPGTEMISAAEKIARRLGISGFFGLDFMIEKDTGVTYLIEMNPRCTPPCPLPLGNGRNLMVALRAQLTGERLLSNQPAIEKNMIAYFPQAAETADYLDHAALDGRIHHDIPREHPELIQELLHPWSGRSIIGKLIDLLRRKEHQIDTPIVLPIEEPRAC